MTPTLICKSLFSLIGKQLTYSYALKSKQFGPVGILLTLLQIS